MGRQEKNTPILVNIAVTEKQVSLSTTSKCLWNTPGMVTPPPPVHSVPLPHHSFREETFPNMQPEPPRHNLLTPKQLQMFTSHPG